MRQTHQARGRKSLALSVEHSLLGLLLLLAGCGRAVPIPPPTQTPLPTRTPAPTYTPYPTTGNWNDLFRPSTEDAAFMQLINQYRAANDQLPLNVFPSLAFLAAWRAQLKMLGFDLQQVPITQAIVGAIMPMRGEGYALREVAFGGKNIEGAWHTDIGTPEGSLQHLLRTTESDPIVLLSPLYEDIGATILCDDSYCAYVVIFGSTHQLGAEVSPQAKLRWPMPLIFPLPFKPPVGA